jgi:hypothetical protein
MPRRPEPEPPRRTPCDLVLEELSDIFAILEKLSLRLRALETRQPGNHPQGGGRET